jgi:hypothetical protein
VADRPKIVEAKTWKEASLEERASLAIAKTCSEGPEPATKASDGEPVERALWWTVSTEQRDRDGDRIPVSGWDLKAFKTNPVVPWAHNYADLPVAKALEVVVDKEKGRLRMLKQFTTKEQNPFGAMVHELARDGFLKAASVGFIPTESEEDPETKDDPNPYRRGWIHKKKELLESSIVVVPSNPGALQQAKSVNGIDLTPYVAWAEKLLDEHHGEAGLWFPRKSIEQIRSIVVPSKPTVIVEQPALPFAEERTHAGPAEPATDPTPAPVPPSADERREPPDAEPTTSPDAAPSANPPAEDKPADARSLETQIAELTATVAELSKTVAQLAVKMATQATGDTSNTDEIALELSDETGADPLDSLYVLSVDEERDEQPDNNTGDDGIEIDLASIPRLVGEVLGTP